MSIKKRNLGLGEKILTLDLEIMKKKDDLAALKKRKTELLKELYEEEEKVDPATLEDFHGKKPKPSSGDEKGRGQGPEKPKKAPKTPSDAKKGKKKGKDKAPKIEEPPKELMGANP